MAIESEWSIFAVTLAAIPVVKSVFWITIHSIHGFHLKDFSSYIQNDQEFKALEISISGIGTFSLADLFKRNPGLLLTLNQYAEYGHKTLLFFEAAGLGITSLSVSLFISLNHS